ncbi:hypothetical protein QYZ44_16110 [Vibrio parahaemolyticus]|nr:hypothetical protein [Vibrio parahaemolyticus]
MFGDRFINILYDLQSFGASEAESREKLADGSIHFPAPPVNAGFDTVLYSGTTYPDILKLKLEMDFYSPYSHIEFRGNRRFGTISHPRLGLRQTLRKTHRKS